MQMKIGILGSRGIPNYYGGFEQFLSYLAPGLAELGWEVWVYNSNNHPYRKSSWKGVNLIYCHDPEDRLGTVGQFVYDLNCIHDSQNRDFDILFQTGYTSNSLWYRWLPEGPEVVTNMDGLEWKRSKYSGVVRRFLKYAEKLAVRSSDILVADSEVIRDYLADEYGERAEYIPYGAEEFDDPDPAVLEKFGLTPQGYYLVIARLQPDNHISEIIEGVKSSVSDKPLIIIGDTGKKYGRMLVKNHASDKVRFHGVVFDHKTLNNLRHYSSLYFHGHSVGGTNPSLLEAMAAGALICAHSNPFNRTILRENAYYFTSSGDIPGIIHLAAEKQHHDHIQGNLDLICKNYRWKDIIKSYHRLFLRMLG